MEKMSFVSRETANAANIFNEMIKDKECTIFLTLSRIYISSWLYAYLQRLRLNTIWSMQLLLLELL